MELFEQNSREVSTQKPSQSAPLAERVRPSALASFAGQEHLLGPGKPLTELIEHDEIPSLIFWGPPGCGKTTLARLIAHQTKAEFFQLNAVASGVQEVRKVIDRATANRDRLQKRTILFIDEIHRFNKAQQDALLHSVEDGVITLIGATTENPSFEVITPLLSRCMVYVLQPLSVANLNGILDHAIGSDPVMVKRRVTLGEKEREHLMTLSSGDARILLNGLETAVRLEKPDTGGRTIVRLETLQQAFQKKFVRYDKSGEEHYNIISAFIKSMRGSDPDGAVYWLARMLEGGEDPIFIARRMVILSSEDIGNADPYALTLATSCFTSVHYVGMPEARIILSQTATYLASAPKSNASYLAIEEALADVRSRPMEDVPLHLRNAPTQLLKDLRYGGGYKYAHDFDRNFVEQDYLPSGLNDRIYYRPTREGKEREIAERLMSLWTKRKS